MQEQWCWHCSTLHHSSMKRLLEFLNRPPGSAKRRHHSSHVTSPPLQHTHTRFVVGSRYTRRDMPFPLCRLRPNWMKCPKNQDIIGHQCSARVRLVLDSVWSAQAKPIVRDEERNTSPGRKKSAHVVVLVLFFSRSSCSTLHLYLRLSSLEAREDDRDEAGESRFCVSTTLKALRNSL